MSRSHSSWLLGGRFGVLSLCGATLLSCGQTSSAPAGTAGASGESDGGSAAAGGSGGAIEVDATSDANSCEVHCSANLRDVVDCHGTVVKTCPPEQGCAPGGVCVAPCEAAKANASTIGCDFHAVPPPPHPDTIGSCYAALIANTWQTPVTLKAEFGGVPLDVESMTRTPTSSGGGISYAPLPGGKLEPGQVAIVFLAAASNVMTEDHVECPAGITPGWTNSFEILETTMGASFHLTTDAPVVAYDMYPYGGAASHVSSASLLVPTTAWGTNYIAVDGYPGGLGQYVQIVAAEDATEVTISPTASIQPGPGVAPADQGQPATYHLDRGQVLQFYQAGELSGSPLASNKPVGVIGGAACVNIPNETLACDSLHQQLLPIKNLGSLYLGVGHRDRIAADPEVQKYTIVGVVDDTTLQYDPVQPPGAPSTLQSGETVRFNASEPFVVRSQNEEPFYLAHHMTGANALPSTDPANQAPGDPDFVNVASPALYLSEYLFLTDPTYGNTHLVFTRAKTEAGTFAEVTLDCLGTITGWHPVGSSGTYEYAFVDLVVDGAPVGACDNGAHEATSDAPFGITVWGWDWYASYAYLAGTSVKPINSVVVTPRPH